MNGTRDALLQEARTLRVSQRVPEALATLARLQAEHPRFSRLYQERGHCHILLRDAPAVRDIDLDAAARLFETTLPPLPALRHG